MAEIRNEEYLNGAFTAGNSTSPRGDIMKCYYLVGPYIVAGTQATFDPKQQFHMVSPESGLSHSSPLFRHSTFLQLAVQLYNQKEYRKKL